MAKEAELSETDALHKHALCPSPGGGMPSAKDDEAKTTGGDQPCESSCPLPRGATNLVRT